MKYPDQGARQIRLATLLYHLCFKTKPLGYRSWASHAFSKVFTTEYTAVTLKTIVSCRASCSGGGAQNSLHSHSEHAVVHSAPLLTSLKTT